METVIDIGDNDMNNSQREGIVYCGDGITELLNINCVLLCILFIPAMHHSTYRTVFRQLHAPAVDLVSDPLTQPPTSSRGAEPSSARAVSVMLDPLLGTVFRTTFTTVIIETGLFKRRLKLNYFAEHLSLLVVSALLDAS